MVIHEYELPKGYVPRTVDLLIRLPATYPDIGPDMFWCSPLVVLERTGGVPEAAAHTEPHLGRIWQRFSRHLNPGQWQGGDRLASYLAMIRQNLIQGV